MRHLLAVATYSLDETNVVSPPNSRRGSILLCKYSDERLTIDRQLHTGAGVFRVSFATIRSVNCLLAPLTNGRLYLWYVDADRTAEIKVIHVY